MKTKDTSLQVFPISLFYTAKGVVFFFSLEKILKALTHSFSRVAVFFFPAQLFDDFGKNNGYFFISAKNKQFLQK